MKSEDLRPGLYKIRIVPALNSKFQTRPLGPGLIERIEGSHRYLPTPAGLRTALFHSRVYARVLRPGLSILHDPRTLENHPAASRMRRLQKEIYEYIIEQIAA